MTKIYGLLQLIIVSTGGIRWILWFSIRYATARREIFGVDALRGKLHQLGSPNLQFTEISLILKNKMANAGISLKIIYIFLLTVSHRYNTYTCPLQPCRHLTLKLLIQGHPRSTKVTHIADLKSAYISLIIGPRGLQCKTNP